MRWATALFNQVVIVQLATSKFTVCKAMVQFIHCRRINHYALAQICTAGDCWQVQLQDS